MKKFSFVVTGAMGIHARPAVMLANAAQKYQCEIRFSCGEKSADAKDLMEVLNLNAACGQNVLAEFCGSDEEAACEGLKGWLEGIGNDEFQVQEK